MSIRKRIDYEAEYGLTLAELDRLSTYNGEKARGLVHTAEWRERMAELQRRFNKASGRNAARDDLV